MNIVSELWQSEALRKVGIFAGFLLAIFLYVVFLTPVTDAKGRKRTLLRGFLIDLPIEYWRVRRARICAQERVVEDTARTMIELDAHAARSGNYRATHTESEFFEETMRDAHRRAAKIYASRLAKRAARAPRDLRPWCIAGACGLGGLTHLMKRWMYPDAVLLMGLPLFGILVLLWCRQGDTVKR